MSCSSSQTVSLSSAMTIRPRRYFGSLPEVALSPYGVAANVQPWARSGFAAAST